MNCSMMYHCPGQVLNLPPKRTFADNALTTTDIERIVAFTGDALQLSAHQDPSQKMIHFYARWALGILSSVVACCDAANAIRQHTTDMNQLSAESTGIAMVMHRDDGRCHVDLVQWTMPGHGRIADIDDLGKLITIVPIGKKQIPINFRHADRQGRVLHPSTSLRMERQRRKDRPSVPAHILQLREIWKVALTDTPYAIWTNADDGDHELRQALTRNTFACALCESDVHLVSHHASSSRQCLDEDNPADSTNANDFIIQCCMCLLHMHRCCIDKVMNAVSLVQSTENTAKYRICESFIHTVEHESMRNDSSPFPLDRELHSRQGYR